MPQPREERHIKSDLEALIFCQKHHPEEPHDPNVLDFFLDANADEPECLVYED